MDITVIKFLKTGEISIPVCRDDRITIYEMMYEYACTCFCSNDMMNHYNQVGVQKWSDLIALHMVFQEMSSIQRKLMRLLM